MRGKDKCKILKEIRQRIADENDIPYVTRECSYQGECTGTCPRRKAGERRRVMRWHGSGFSRMCSVCQAAHRINADRPDRRSRPG